MGPMLLSVEGCPLYGGDIICHTVFGTKKSPLFGGVRCIEVFIDGSSFIA